MVTPIEIHGVLLNPTNDMVVRVFRETNSFEDEAVKFWTRHLQSGSIAVDVGAYSGLYAMIAASAGCLPIAYEPNPIVFKRLRENTQTNKLNIDIRNQAVSDVEGKLAFYIKPDTILTSASSLVETPGFRKVLVDVIKLESNEPVCAIKVDVEGSELSVLKGAKALLEKWKPAVLVECLTPEAESDITAFMEGLNYSKIQLDSRNFGFE